MGIAWIENYTPSFLFVPGRLPEVLSTYRLQVKRREMYSRQEQEQEMEVKKQREESQAEDDAAQARAEAAYEATLWA